METLSDIVAEKRETLADVVASMRAAKNPGGGGLWKLSRRR